MVESAHRRNVRKAVMKARDNEVLTGSDAGFIVTLVERFRSDVEKKIKQVHVLQGEIAQLKTNEKIIVDLIENIIAASERDKARRETAAKIRGLREGATDESDDSSQEKEDTKNEEPDDEKVINE
jgi:hypothetical protein